MQTQRSHSPGRPPRNGVAANRRVSILLTDAEKDQIDALAEARGLTLCDLVRVTLLGSTPTPQKQTAR